MKCAKSMNMKHERSIEVRYVLLIVLSDRLVKDSVRKRVKRAADWAANAVSVLVEKLMIRTDTTDAKRRAKALGDWKMMRARGHEEAAALACVCASRRRFSSPIFLRQRAISAGSSCAFCRSGRSSSSCCISASVADSDSVPLAESAAFLSSARLDT